MRTQLRRLWKGQGSHCEPMSGAEGQQEMRKNLKETKSKQYQH